MVLGSDCNNAGGGIGEGGGGIGGGGSSGSGGDCASGDKDESEGEGCGADIVCGSCSPKPSWDTTRELVLTLKTMEVAANTAATLQPMILPVRSHTHCCRPLEG